MSKVVVTRSLSPEANQTIASCLGPSTQVVAWPHDSACDRAWLLDNVEGAAGIVVMLSDKVDDELLDKAGPNLKVISTMSVGYDHIALPSLQKRGIKLGYTPDVLTDAVADLTCMLALMGLRRAKESTQLVQSGKWGAVGWGPFMLCGAQLTGKTIGFLGMGRISEATASRLAPFGASRIIYSNSGRDRSSADAALSDKIRLPVEKLDLETLAKESDLVVVLCSGGPATMNLVGGEFLGRMKKTSVLVNCARGSVVDNDALFKALENGQILGAALDVIAGEPHIAPDHPLVLQPRCTILPHIGSAATETRELMAQICADNLAQGVRGEELRIELKA